MIKFDIEGAELDALSGGRRTIRKNLPVLAVSTYHQQSHLWEIPLAIAGIAQPVSLRTAAARDRRLGPGLLRDPAGAVGALMPHRACPVCGGEGIEAPVRATLRSTFRRAPAGRLRHRGVPRIAAPAFADDIPEQAAFDEYYREFSKYEGAMRAMVRRPRSRRGSRSLRSSCGRFIPGADARILEIGCGYGQLLWVLRAARILQRIGRRSFARLRARRPALLRRPGDRQHRIHRAGAREPYDFLILTGVMEHIRDLDRTVERFHSTSRAGGARVPAGARREPLGAGHGRAVSGIQHRAHQLFLARCR